MIDTVRLRIEDGIWRERPTGWSVSHSSKVLEEAQHGLAPVETHTAFYYHEETGMRIGGSFDLPRWVEVSLPRLVYGQNGVLLKECDCEQSMLRLRDMVGQCVKTPEYGELSRLDLVAQFRGDTREWGSALRLARHKRIRRTGVEFFDTGNLEWQGKELVARLYDKGLEVDGHRSEIVRLEFQTRGKVLPHSVLRRDGGIHYGRAYEAYGRLCRGFEPKAVPRLHRISELLAWCDLCGFNHEGLRPTDLYLASVSERQRRRLRAKIANARLRYFEIDWEVLVPAFGSAPCFVDYEQVAA